MNTALIYTAFLGVMVVVIWITARKAGRAEKALEYAKRENGRQKNAGEILNRYVNLSSYELSQRVLEKRKTSAKHMHSKD